MKLSSSAFADGTTIPRRFTADGDDISPRLTWSGSPGGTVSYALVCEDPDAPSGTFVHWLAWNIPADRHELPDSFPKVASVTAGGIAQGENGFGRVGWSGPKPPPGKPHRYVFHLFALDAKLPLHAGASRADFDRALAGHALDEAVLTGTYKR
jgi:Raf kinase inhibitor-like YbhB/YbcL family protein